MYSLHAFQPIHELKRGVGEQRVLISGLFRRLKNFIFFSLSFDRLLNTMGRGGRSSGSSSGSRGSPFGSKPAASSPPPAARPSHAPAPAAKSTPAAAPAAAAPASSGPGLMGMMASSVRDKGIEGHWKSFKDRNQGIWISMTNQTR